MILDGIMFQIIYTVVFRVKRLNNLAHRVRLFLPINSKTRGIDITMKQMDKSLGNDQCC